MRSSELVLARVYYALWIGAFGFSSPFANLFYRQRGLSGAEIGLVITCAAAVGLVMSPLWGRWSDSGAPLPRLLQLALVATAGALLLLSQQSEFGWIALVVSLQAVSNSGISPLSDALALRVTEARRAGYGSVRVFGSAGWALSVLVSGWLISRTSLVAGFFGTAVGYLGAAALLLRIPKNLHALPRTAAQERGSLRTAARELVNNRALSGLALALIVRGMLSDGHNQFGNIYLQQLGASTAVIGVASMVAAVVELPGMFIADRVVKRIGARRTVLISFFLTGGKLFLVLAFPAIWSILATRAFEGFAFSLYLIGMIKFITERASGAHTAMMLALFTVTLTALIQILGAPIGGIVFDAVGALWLYALAVTGNFAASAIFFGLPRGGGEV